MGSQRPSHMRRVRYGAPIALIVVTILFAAVDTNQFGNDVQLAGTAAGLIWLLAAVGRDMGMGASSGRPPRVPDPPTTSDVGAGSDDDDQPLASSS